MDARARSGRGVGTILAAAARPIQDDLLDLRVLEVKHGLQKSTNRWAVRITNPGGKRAGTVQAVRDAIWVFNDLAQAIPGLGQVGVALEHLGIEMGRFLRSAFLRGDLGQANA